MRILEAFGEPISYGGQEAFVMNALPHIDSSDMTIDLLSPYYCDNNSTVQKVRERGGEVYALNCRFSPGNVRSSEAAPIRKFLCTHHYDVIHIHSGSNSMLSMYARLAHKAGIPRIIVHSHCTGKHGWKHFASKALTSFSLRRYPDEYCACSQEAGEWRFPADICRGRLIVINNGIDISRFRYNENVRSKVREELGLSDGTVLIGSVGRLAYQKNQEFLIDMLKKIKADPGISGDYRLILVGDGEDRRYLEEKSAGAGLAKDVIFTGAVDDVTPYLQAMDVAAMPSRYEGLAIAVIEAQAAGLEIIASDAIPEAAALTENVTFIPVSDEDSWAAALKRKHSRHPEQADQVADNGYSTVRTAEVLTGLYRK